MARRLQELASEAFQRLVTQAPHAAACDDRALLHAPALTHCIAAQPAAAAVSYPAGRAEERIDPTNMQPYTYESFVECYGAEADARWAAAIRSAGGHADAERYLSGQLAPHEAAMHGSSFATIGTSNASRASAVPYAPHDVRGQGVRIMSDSAYTRTSTAPAPAGMLRRAGDPYDADAIPVT